MIIIVINILHTPILPIIIIIITHLPLLTFTLIATEIQLLYLFFVHSLNIIQQSTSITNLFI